MKHVKPYLASMLACAAMSVVAAPAAKQQAFSPVPRQALVELKATVGKPFSAGLVFVNGRFIDPPYKVERFGTALRINGIQVTNEIFPWTEFLKTQDGVRIEKIDPPPSAAVPAPEVPQEVEEPPEVDDSAGTDIDDLFDDDPKPKKPAAKKTVRRQPKAPPAPQPIIKVSFDGEFKHNDKTKAMVAKINKERTRIETALRNGGSCFFGVRYLPVVLDRFPTDMFLSTMPAVMKDNASFEPFSAAARAKGVSFLSESVMRDVFHNRLDYVRLLAREKAVKEERKWGSMLQGIR